MINLSYEQYKALQIMYNSPDKEGSVIANEADCSWDELFDLFTKGLSDSGAQRLSKNQLHPLITEHGIKTLLDWNKSNKCKSLINTITMNQVLAGEQAVINNLKSLGLKS